MKLIQFIVSVVLFALATFVAVSQVINSQSLVGGVAYAAIAVMLGGLVRLSYDELKESRL